MADGTRIDDATLHAAAGDCRSAMDSIKGEATKVRNSKENVAATWQGVASMTFQGVIDKYLVDTDKLLNALDNIAGLLEKNANVARTNEEEQDKMFNQFNSVING